MFFLAASLTAAPTWEPTIYPENQIFPSVLISTATLNEPEEVLGKWQGPHLGHEVGLIGVYLDDAEKGDRVRVEVEPNKFIEGGEIEVILPSEEASWMIHPTVDYNYDALSDNLQPRPENVKLKVSVNGKSLGEKSVRVNVRSLNDCLFAVAEAEGNESDYAYLFAAYVNENHPWVDRILGEALDTGIVNSFDGYQSEDPDVVVAQIFAIWHAMQQRGLKYSDITTTSFSSDTVFSQHVRLFEDSIDARQANCVDGTVLLAAVLRKIGLFPYLVIIPGHMFLAVDLDEDGDDYIGLETTLMGDPDTENSDGGTLSTRLHQAFSEIPSWASFSEAVRIGTEEIDEAWDSIESETDLQYQIVGIEDARELGIQPISRVSTP